MCHHKALANDPTILRDESADPVERAAALSRLVSDQRREFEQDIFRFLTHHEPILRAKAIVALAGRWHLDKYVSFAKCMLKDDSDWLVRCNAAHALSIYAQLDQVREQERRLILRTLAEVVQTDSNVGVQEAAYEAVLRILKRPAKEYFHLTRDFNAQQDVNWRLLEPYLN